FVVVEDHRTILLTCVVALPIQRSRIVYRKEHIEDIAKTDLFRIERDAHDFHVSGITAAHLTVGWIIDVSAHVAILDVRHTCETLENGFDTPETSAAENRCLLFCHGG